MMSKFKSWGLHPFLFTSYAILGLASANLGEVSGLEILRPLVVCILGTSILLILLRIVTRSWIKAALATSLVVVLFFTYGHVYSLVEDAQVFGLLIGRHRFLMAAWALLFAFGFGIIVLAKRDLHVFNHSLNIFTLILVAFPIIQIGWTVALGFVRSGESSSITEADAVLPTELRGLKYSGKGSPPDIYYIVLDSYTRRDTLIHYFDFDNSDLMNGLEEMGFVIAGCSQSNYSSTDFSLGSSLNLDYLDNLGLTFETGQDLSRLVQMNFDNHVRSALETAGYKTVVVASGYSVTEWPNVDTFLSMDEEGRKGVLGRITEFESLMFKTSLGVLLYEFPNSMPAGVSSFLDSAYMERRDRILFALDQAVSLAEVQSPKLIFMHVLAPHEPFVFTRDGGYVDRDSPFLLNDDQAIRDKPAYIQGYKDEVHYLNGRVLEMLQTILEGSKTPPIIIIQGDHGASTRATSLEARLTILNAYYLPGAPGSVYPTITPVNTFRLLFNTYFGTSLELLPDESYLVNQDGQDVEFEYIPSSQIGCTTYE